jgi:hypothetical protein
MFFIVDFLFSLLAVAMLIGLFFIFDEAILKGYFATKLRKRFDVESLK